MRHAFAALTLSLTVIAPSGAQEFLCPPAAPGDFSATFFDFIPAAPSSSQPITIRVGYEYAFPSGAVASVTGNVINVTIDGLQEVVILPPPMECVEATVGPLPVGTYTVNLIGVYSPDPPNTPAPILLETNTLLVTADGTASATAAIPTLQTASLVALTLLVALAGIVVYRRRALVRRV